MQISPSKSPSSEWASILLMLLTAGFLAQGVVVTLKTTTNASLQIIITTLAAEGNGNSSSSTTSTATSDHSSPDENDQVTSSISSSSMSTTTTTVKLVKHPFLLVVTLFTFSFTVCIMSACICLQRSSDRGHEEANLASMSVYKDAQEDLRKYISSIYEMKKPAGAGQAGATTKANRQGPSCRSVLEETAVPILEPKSRISSRKARSKVKSSKSGNV